MSNLSFIVPSFEDLDKLTFDLAKQILGRKKAYDRVVILAKGGWSMGRSLVDYLGIRIASSIQFISYQGTKKMSQPKLVQPLPHEDEIKGEKVLIFDDVADSGETLWAAKKYLERLGAGVETAVVFFKPYSKIKPDFYSEKTSSWVVFPHEKREFIEQMSALWQREGLTKEKIRQKLVSLSLPESVVDYFLSKDYNTKIKG